MKSVYISFVPKSTIWGHSRNAWNEGFVTFGLGFGELSLKIDEIQEFDEERVKKIEYWNKANDSELARIFENADERDLLTVCYIAVRKSPIKYLTVLMDYLLEKEEN